MVWTARAVDPAAGRSVPTRRGVLRASAAALPAIGLAAAAAACGTEPPRAPEQAAGRVEFWYGLNADGVQPFVDDFKREFPQIDLNLVITADHANKLYTA